MRRRMRAASGVENRSDTHVSTVRNCSACVAARGEMRMSPASRETTPSGCAQRDATTDSTASAGHEASVSPSAFGGGGKASMSSPSSCRICTGDERAASGGAAYAIGADDERDDDEMGGGSGFATSAAHTDLS